MSQRPCKGWMGDSWRSVRNICLSFACELVMPALKPADT